MNKKYISGKVQKLFFFIVLIALVSFNLGTAAAYRGERFFRRHASDGDVRVGKQGYNPLLTSSPPQNTGPVLVVTNTNMEENGSYWDPFLLIANPGPDGISFAEAVHSVSADNGLHETITFDPSLSGSVIDASQGFINAITADGVTIDGDLDDDGLPDITLDGKNMDSNGVWLWAASHVIIEGLDIRNFNWGGIRITNNVEVAGLKVFEDIAIRNNRISGIGHKGAVEILLEDVDFGAIQDIEIVGNTIHDDNLGVYIDAAWGNVTDNEISHVSIISNTITGGITIRAAGGLDSSVSRNTVSNVVIRGNHINDDAILIDTANRSNCNDNTIRDVVIANNEIDVSPVGIEIVSVGKNGWNSTGNRVENITITDNVLTGGIQISGATGGSSNNNTMSGIMIDRNHITSCAANGIFLIAGNNGAHHNLIEDTFIRNNLVAYCSGAGVLLAGEDQYSPYNAIREVTLVNLTLVDNGIGSAWAGGLNISSKWSSNIISGVTVSNTILYGNNFADAIRGSEVPDSVTYSILNDVRFTGSNGNIYASPKFVEPTAWDYSLQPGSPAIDTGDPSAENVGALDLGKRVRLWDGDDDTVPVVDRGAWEYAAPLAQEIDVQGSGFSILSGDTVPGYWDGTDFGVASVTAGAVGHTFTLHNTGGLTLTLTGDPIVSITGNHAPDFAVTMQPQSTIPPSGSTTFTVAFDPSAVGLRRAVVSIANDDSDEHPYTFAVKGTGVSEAIKIHLPLVLR